MSRRKIAVYILNLFVMFEVFGFIVLYSKCYHSIYVEYASRSTLTLIFIAGIIILGIMFVLKRFPRLYPFPVKVNAKNMMFQAWLAELFLTILSLICTLVFFVILYSQYLDILMIDKKMPTIPAYVPICLIASIFICIITYIIIARRHK